MDWLIEIVKIAVATGIATTFDDNIYLTGFFSEVNRTFRPVHVVVGELVGFTALVSVSLLGFLLGLIIPPIYIGLLGILPILIGFTAAREFGGDLLGGIGLRGAINRDAAHIEHEVAHDPLKQRVLAHEIGPHAFFMGRTREEHEVPVGRMRGAGDDELWHARVAAFYAPALPTVKPDDQSLHDARHDARLRHYVRQASPPDRSLT